MSINQKLSRQSGDASPDGLILSLCVCLVTCFLQGFGGKSHRNDWKSVVELVQHVDSSVSIHSHNSVKVLAFNCLDFHLNFCERFSDQFKIKHQREISADND